MPELEMIPANEAAHIADIAKLTIKQLERRYGGSPAKPILRGVHAKGHGCVRASFKVNDDLPANLCAGIFATPGRTFDAVVRFSNAAVAVTDDSPLKQMARSHGSRGMAVKLLDVTGEPLIATSGPLTQDFLMINQPVFAFGNIADYLTLSTAIENTDDTDDFVKSLIAQARAAVQTEDTKRAARTLHIFQRVQSLKMERNSPGGAPPVTGAYENPPASPLDNQYFGAAPFLLGPNLVMKFSAKPAAPPLNLEDPDYLRNALKRRLTAPVAEAAIFKFLLQVRTAEDIAAHVSTAIEDATLDWPEADFPLVEVATITIPPQDFDTADQKAECERLKFSPWHGLAAHRPLGGINRLRRPVYETSSGRRLSENAAGGCPTGGA